MIKLNLQNNTDNTQLPSKALITTWLNMASTFSPLENCSQNSINMLITDIKQMSALNKNFRDKEGPTNVLSFPDEVIPGVDSDSLGDIAICAEIVEQEANAQHKPVVAHWAHLVIHGFLHLQGYDHIKNKDAMVMEALEIQILKQLGFDNPYEV
ncbi:MAG: rRNA maturation RNase YbeY [Gammaproteobacteria bacterium RIFCSPHIGHO2_12_FULL_41_15]|nr:MAG: rRNA maturation RNase YbeY [Gammaproteobacteria bacterium RIFCSPHIGHO2_12_FULL_41_15]